MQHITGGEAVIESLIANGIDTVFGLPGAQLDPMFAALHDRQARIRIVHSRHEQGAAYMAFGFAEVSGEIGTLLVVPGPGFLNAGAGIVTAYACGTPMLCLVGQGRSELVGKGLGILHEIPNQLETARGLVKWADTIAAAREIPAKMAAAIDEIRHHRPRPAYLELPFDLVKDKTAIPATMVASQEPQKPALNAEDIASAATALAKAKRPLIMCGGGAQMAGREILALAGLLNAPVAMTKNGLGTIDARHALAFTPLGAHKWWATTDVVLALGTRLYPSALEWGTDAEIQIIKVDIDADELRRLDSLTHRIHGDVADVAREMYPAVDALMTRKAPDRSDEIETVRQAVEDELEAVAPQRELLNVIRQTLGDDGILVADLTQLFFVSQDAYPVYAPRTYVQPSYQGTLGHAVATALGAQIAAPDRPVISLAGDGGFMFTVQELATAVQYNIPVKFLVMNDGAFGNVKRILEQDYGHRSICADLKNPDFVKLAESFGMPARRADTAKGLRTALRESIAEPGPALVEFLAPEFPSPWPLHLLPKVRG